MITSASAQSKDLAARIAARRSISVVQDVIQSMALHYQLQFTPVKQSRMFQLTAMQSSA